MLTLTGLLSVGPLLAVIAAGLLLAVIAAYCVLARWPTPRRISRLQRVALCALLGVAMLLMTLACSPCVVSDGSYPQAEFQLVLKDPAGKPLEGVELRVEDQEGRNYFHYPVNDYLPGKVPASDRDGVIVFHHVPEGVEYSSRTTYVFGVIPIVEQRPPTFICRFLREGQEVCRIPFRELCSWLKTSEDYSKVTRRWIWPVWRESQLLLQPYGNGEDWDSRRLKLFDLNGNGKLDPEEAAAWSAAVSSRAEWVAKSQLRGEDVQEELEFGIIRNTIAHGIAQTRR